MIANKNKIGFDSFYTLADPSAIVLRPYNVCGRDTLLAICRVWTEVSSCDSNNTNWSTGEPCRAGV